MTAEEYREKYRYDALLELITRRTQFQDAHGPNEIINSLGSFDQIVFAQELFKLTFGQHRHERYGNADSLTDRDLAVLCAVPAHDKLAAIAAAIQA